MKFMISELANTLSCLRPFLFDAFLFACLKFRWLFRLAGLLAGVGDSGGADLPSWSAPGQGKGGRWVRLEWDIAEGQIPQAKAGVWETGFGLISQAGVGEAGG